MIIPRFSLQSARSMMMLTQRNQTTLYGFFEDMRIADISLKHQTRKI